MHEAEAEVKARFVVGAEMRAWAMKVAGFEHLPQVAYPWDHLAYHLLRCREDLAAFALGFARSDSLDPSSSSSFDGC